MSGLAKRFGINPTVFLGSAAAVAIVAIFGASLPGVAEAIFGAAQIWIVNTIGWFYMLAFGGVLFFVIALAISPYGKIKLGPDDSVPDYSYISWFAMLFSAGMGIGLMFFSVAEPLTHYATPPRGGAETIDAARNAIQTTFFHWGYHGWAVYALVGMVLAYFAFRHDLPLSPRAALFPVLGRRIDGPVGDAVDIFAVIGTMFGVATSMGVGILQLNAGANYLFGVPVGLTTQLIMMAAITGIAVCSAMAGLDAGMQRLSQINIILAVVFLLFVTVTGPWQFMLQATVQNYGAYVSGLVGQTFLMYAYNPSDWLGSWTLFYWGWWIAWSPFVGMFIARVSRGRTIREFVVGVLLAPAAFTFIWMGFFGNAAFDLVMSGAAPDLAQAVRDDISVALYRFLEHFPLSSVVSFIATFLVVTFFVTSADAGSLVIVTIASGGRRAPPQWQRVFWSVLVGLVAAILLLAGGLTGLQTMTVVSALPFLIVLFLMMWGLIQSLGMENSRRLDERQPKAWRPAPISVTAMRKRLALRRKVLTQAEARAFLAEAVKPAIAVSAAELEHSGMEAAIVEQGPDAVGLEIRYPGEQRREFVYACALRISDRPVFSMAGKATEADPIDRYRVLVSLHERPNAYDIVGFTEDDVLEDIAGQYERHMRIRLANDAAPAPVAMAFKVDEA